MDKEKIFEIYMEWVYEVAEECDWKTEFTPREIVFKICDIIERDNDS